MAFKKTIPNLLPGTYGFKFTPKGADTGKGAPSAVFQFTVTGDATPPPVPSKPIATATYGGASIKWVDSSYQVPIDFGRVDVYASANGGAYLKFGSIFAINGTATFENATAGVPYTFKFVALDNSGNGSSFSEASDPVTPLALDIDSVPPLEVLQSSIVTSWSGTTLSVNFNKNASTDATSYIIRLTANGITIPFTLAAGADTLQRFSLTESQARATFGGFYTSYTGIIQSLDKFNNASTGTSFTTIAYNDTINNAAILDASWNLTAANGGYIASWTIVDPNYYEAEVWESSTQNGTYSLVASGLSPLLVKVSGLTTKWVKIRYVGKAANSFSQYSNPKSIAPIDAIVFDDIAPENTISNTGFSATPGIDPNGKYQFAGFIDLAWQAISNDTTIRGYRIRYRKGSSTDPYTYADVPGASASSFRLDGLLIGGVYEIGVSPYDELGNVNSTYKTYSNTTISGTAVLSQGAIITAGDMEFGYGVKDSTGTTTGAEKGLWLDSDDYWYIKSGQSSRFSVGSTNNKLLWDGTDLSVTGKIYAKGGSIDGNLDVIDGTIRARTSTTSAAKVEINSAGIQATSDGLTNTVTISSTDGSITAKSGTIGGWTLTENSFSKPLAGLYAPASPVNSDVAFWAGSSLANRATADFRVQYDGKVSTGAITITGGSLNINNVFKVSTAGVLEATGATINGALTVTSPSEIQSNLTITGGGEIKVGTSTDYVKIGSTGVLGVGGGAVKTQLTTSGYLSSISGDIGGWSISAGGISTTGTGANASSSVKFNKWASASNNIIEVTNASGISTFKVNGNGDVEVRGTITILDSGGTPSNFLTSADVGPSGSTVISGGRITTGVMSGDRITGGTITGTSISGGTFSLTGSPAYNYWTSGEFRAGISTSYIQVNTSGTQNTITIYSRPNQESLNEGGTNDGTSTSTTGTISIPQQITVDETSIKIQGLPGVGNGLTALGSLEAFGSGAADEYITQYQSGIYGTINPIAADAPTRTYGKAARYRTVIADPYDYNKLKRGFGIYYGTRSTAPGASTGYVGDIWVSW
jgi:hypothetical protein